MSPDEPTDIMPGGPDEPTEVNHPGDEPTGRIPEGNEDPTRQIPEGNDDGTEPLRPEAGGGASHGADGSGGEAGMAGYSRGIGVLVAAILASLVLVAAYIVAGGPVGPSEAADPCDARPWTDPGNLEEAAQQFALSAADGAACELGVSREELTRSIADDNARQKFMDDHGFTEGDLEEALRAGLNRAVDDAENAGALGGLAPAAIRAAIRVMPMSVMIGLLENADSIFNGDFGSLGSLGDAIDAITGGVDSFGSGTTDDPIGSLGDVIEKALPEGTTDDLREAIPEETRRKLEETAKEKLNQGLEELLAP